MYTKNADTKQTKLTAMKCIFGTGAAILSTIGFTTLVFAALPTNPGSYGTASPNAQCGTAAESGAFNAHNSIYGPNSRLFGLDGGSGGGQAGINNSAVCGNR